MEYRQYFGSVLKVFGKFADTNDLSRFVFNCKAILRVLTTCCKPKYVHSLSSSEMSWNPFKKAKPATKQTGDWEFEREVARFNQLEGATKKIYKDTKKYGEALSALSKAELRIYQDLATSPVALDDLFREPLQEYAVCVERLDELRQELASRNQKTVTEPMKKFSGVFPSVNAAIKRRDQALQDYQKYQAKVLKLQEREKTPQIQAKLETNNQALAAAKLDYEKQNAVMLEDLPQLIEGRIDYFEPSFEAVIRSGASYYSQASEALADLTNKLGWKKGELSDEDCQQQLQQKLAEIRSLSIVEDG